MKRSLIAASVAVLSLVIGACSSEPDDAFRTQSYKAGTYKIDIDGKEYPLELPGDAKFVVKDGQILPDNANDLGPFIEAYRSDVGNEQFYFVMTDRFANGDKTNDDGGLGGDRTTSGFDPTDSGFYMGGDIAGMKDKLDYIAGLGTTAIWLTPPFVNQAVQGPEGSQSAGYHGYWITDFTRIDPHYGTNEEMKEFIDAAHDKGIKVYFDIITNHTADTISYANGNYSYKTTLVVPYKDATGADIDTYALAGKDFPQLDAATSFPYKPVASVVKKTPESLNDVTMYHNRGNTTWSGESVTYGDFDGLDDLMTENKAVVDGMADIYKAWVDFGIDGFRIDTVKHVNFEFWEDWTEQIAAAGGEDFFMFGEVYEANPQVLAEYPRKTSMDGVLDFGFQSAAVAWAKGGDGSGLGVFFSGDAYYTTNHSGAGDLPTFLGNHDMGRVSYLLAGSSDVVERTRLAHELMYLTRGQPVVYYGDEQGFVGAGGDKAARQPLFGTLVDSFQKEPLADGTVFGTGEHYSTEASLYKEIAALSQLRKDTPALSDGAQVTLGSKDSGFVFSRIDPTERFEYIVGVNSGTAPVTIDVETMSPGVTYDHVYSTDGVADGTHLQQLTGGPIKVTIPPLSTVVYKGDQPAAEAKDVRLLKSVTDDVVELSARMDKRTYADSSFAYRVLGTKEWVQLGTGSGPEARVYHDISGFKEGTVIQYAVVLGNTGMPASEPTVQDWTILHIGGPEAKGELMVTAPGSFNVAAGCDTDWDPGCGDIFLEWDGKAYSKEFDLVPGMYEFKIAINGDWAENYGDGGALDGKNITFDHKGGKVTISWDPVTKVATVK